jgi:hypothetical protein
VEEDLAVGGEEVVHAAAEGVVGLGGVARAIPRAIARIITRRWIQRTRRRLPLNPHNLYLISRPLVITPTRKHQHPSIISHRRLLKALLPTKLQTTRKFILSGVSREEFGAVFVDDEEFEALAAELDFCDGFVGGWGGEGFEGFEGEEGSKVKLELGVGRDQN